MTNITYEFAKEVQRLLAYGDRRHSLAYRFKVPYEVIARIDNLSEQQLKELPNE